MDLYVLRHGVADDRDFLKYPDDTLRPLTSKGTRRLVRQVAGMNSIKLSPDVIITSPLVRAVQTAEIVHERLHRPCSLAISDALVPGADPSEVLIELSESYRREDSVMVVGHEPHLSRLVSMVSTGEVAPMIRLRKGALCKLRISSPAPARCGWIEWSLTPRQMIGLGSA